MRERVTRTGSGGWQAHGRRRTEPPSEACEPCRSVAESLCLRLMAMAGRDWQRRRPGAPEPADIAGAVALGLLRGVQPPPEVLASEARLQGWLSACLRNAAGTILRGQLCAARPWPAARIARPHLDADAAGPDGPTVPAGREAERACLDALPPSLRPAAILLLHGTPLAEVAKLVCDGVRSARRQALLALWHLREGCPPPVLEAGRLPRDGGQRGRLLDAVQRRRAEGWPWHGIAEVLGVPGSTLFEALARQRGQKCP